MTVIVAPLLGLVFTPPSAPARPNVRTAFFTEYPNSVGSVIDTVPSHPAHCGVCHYDFNGGGARNPYGVRLGQVINNYPNTLEGRREAIRSIQNEDSDADSYTTLVEVTDETSFTNTPTFPGLIPANVGNVSHVVIAEIQGYLIPLPAPDTTPPSVTVLAPNGSEAFPGNAPIQVQWTATDPSGVGRIELFLSDDGGAAYRRLTLPLPNSGSHTVFLPNRPTGQALIRVLATDTAGNVGQDECDSTFTIVANPTGLAPTTLRDFDQPGSQPFAASPTNPINCSFCHGNYDLAVEPWFNWQGSMMAHASRDILFEACLVIANQDAPDSGDLCLRCHIPNGWLGGRSVPTSGAQMLESDKVGISCHLCHTLVDPIYSPENPAEDVAILAGLADPPTTFSNGMYVLDPAGVRRGPFADAYWGHAILVSPFHRDAAICGTCHDVSNPAFERDANGNYPPNAFDAPPADMSAHRLMPLERTYSEWLHSAYNSPTGVYAPQFGGNRDYVSICQDCHMRAVTGTGCDDPNAPVRLDLPLHDMTGGSTWLPSLLSALYPGQINEPAVQAGILRARYMLQNAAHLTAVQQYNRLVVRVTNNTGHKLPTGYPEGRRIWLNVRFFDSAGNLLGESGHYDATTGTLNQDAAVKIYEAKLGLDTDTAGLVGVPPGPSFHFVLNNRIYKDNRIPPRGFSNAAFTLFGGAPVGHTYADGQYWDDTRYVLPPGTASVTVTLYYQSASREFIEFLRDANTTNSVGQQLFDLWSNNGRCPPETMKSQTIPLVVVPQWGDIDADGDVDVDDAQALAAVLVGTDHDPAHVAYADMNLDDEVNGKDIAPFVNAILPG